jgi:hypothetical protein
VPSFLVETYVPRSAADGRRRTARALRSAAAELSSEGTTVRYVRTTFLPDDETCFHLFEAGTPGAVAELSRRAGLVQARIVPAFEEQELPAPQDPRARQPSANVAATARSYNGTDMTSRSAPGTQTGGTR